MLDDVQPEADRSDSAAELQPWDVGFDAVTKQQSSDSSTSADQSATMTRGEDVSLEDVVRRVFNAASRSYGITVVERDDLPGFAAGARSFEVFEHAAEQRRCEGTGLFLLDLYALPSKSGGRG